MRILRSTWKGNARAKTVIPIGSPAKVRVHDRAGCTETTGGQEAQDCSIEMAGGQDCCDEIAGGHDRCKDIAGGVHGRVTHKSPEAARAKSLKMRIDLGRKVAERSAKEGFRNEREGDRRVVHLVHRNDQLVNLQSRPLLAPDRTPLADAPTAVTITREPPDAEADLRHLLLSCVTLSR